MNILRSLTVNLACCLILLSFTGCLEIETTTRVHSDGSLQRTIQLQGDSADMLHKAYPIRFDAYSQGKVSKIQNGKFTQTLSRTFADTKELNEVLKGSEGKLLGATVKLEKKFRWFFTTLVYTETYSRFDPFHGVPIERYFSKDQLDRAARIMTHKSSDSLKADSLLGKAYETWMSRNIFEAFFTLFTDAVRKANDPDITSLNVQTNKELLFDKGRKTLDEGDLDQLGKIYAEVLHAPIDRVIEAKRAEFEQFKEKREFVNRLLQSPYTVSVILPGLITTTNAPTLIGNKATWKDFMNYCYFNDYSLVMESRVTNWWAVIVSGVVVLGLLVLLIISLLHRRVVV